MAIGVYGIELNAHNQIDFYIEHSPSTLVNALRFRLQVNDQEYGWRNIKFNFLASQSSLLQVSMQVVSQFSGG